MLRLSKLADYGVVILAALARRPEEQVTASQLSEETHLPVPTVAKLLKKLAKSGHVRATRGAAGGYRLAIPAGEITAVSIIEAVDGPIQIVSCAGKHPKPCARKINCTVKGSWDPINTIIRNSLSRVTLSELVSLAPPNEGEKKSCPTCGG